jgi:hypothetical protein
MGIVLAFASRDGAPCAATRSADIGARHKDNMLPGSNELMFGKKAQVPDEGQTD